ncbi:MAG: LysR family transcriptional regulator [Gammaproteobacteria bacterium]|nr:LysR family transcriptional regulator [Gammaproteobacteria bacterium]
MEIRRLRYFVAVAEELSFTRAAQRLHIAQPPLSIQIRALEQEVGARLFDRDQRHVSLTQAGKHLLERARGILASLESAKAEVAAVALGELGSLRLGYASSAMFTSSLTSAIKLFQIGYPHVLLTLHELPSLDQLNHLHSRRLDAGILRRSDASVPSGILIEEWYRAPLVAAMANDHPLTKRRAIGIGDLRGQPLIMYPRDSGIGLYWQILRLCEKAGFRPHIVREVQELTSIIGLVDAGVGIAIVPVDTRSIHLEGVTYVPLRDKEAYSTLYLAYRDRDGNPHLRGLLSQLRDQDAALRLAR